MLKIGQIKYVGFLLLFSSVNVMADETNGVTRWNGPLRTALFGEREIETVNPIIELKAPLRAANPALVPVKIISKIEQQLDRYVKFIYLIIDKNPKPLAGKFRLTAASGQADLSMRIRVNEYSNVRVIAELNDGSLSMASRFVKASGGCSAPAMGDVELARTRLGKIRLFLRGKEVSGQPLWAQFMINHPNITGLQMDPLTRMYAPEYYVSKVDISFNGKNILSAETDISMSENPTIGFYFMPSGIGELKIKVEDSNGLVFLKSEMISIDELPLL